jgi:hypothetical protein
MNLKRTAMAMTVLVAAFWAAAIDAPAPGAGAPGGLPAQAGGPCAPESLAFSPDGSLLAVADRGGGRIVFLAPADGTIRSEARLRGRPADIAWIGACRALVSENGTGTLAEVDAESACRLGGPREWSV